MTETNHSDQFNKLMTTISKWEENDYDNLKIKVVDKYRIMSLFIPREHLSVVQNARKNNSSLKKDNMTYLLGEALVKLFISVCKMNTNPLQEHETRTIVSSGAFRRLIGGTLEEMEELYDEVENLKSKNLRGYIKEEEHMKEVDEFIDVGKKLLEENKKLRNKLDEQEKYYKDKLKSRSKRYTDTEQLLKKQLDILEGCGVDEPANEVAEQDSESCEVVYY